MATFISHSPAQSEGVVKSTMTDIHPPNEDLRRSTLGKLSAALDREGVAVHPLGAVPGEAPAVSSGGVVLVAGALTRRSEPARDVVRPQQGFGKRSTDVQSPTDFARSAYGRESFRELQAASGPAGAPNPLPTLLMPRAYTDLALDYVAVRAPQPFPMEPDRPRVIHRAASSDAGELHHHGTLRGSPLHVAPPPGRASARDRFSPHSELGASLGLVGSGASAGADSLRGGGGRGNGTARTYGAVIAQLGAAITAAGGER